MEDTLTEIAEGYGTDWPTPTLRSTLPPMEIIEVDYSNHVLDEWVIERVKEAMRARGWIMPDYTFEYQETGMPYRYTWWGTRKDRP